MVENDEYSSSSSIQWLGEPKKFYNKLPHQAIYEYYTECIYRLALSRKTLTIKIGDFVRVAIEGNGGDIARILYLYENERKIEPYRAKVEWFSNFSSISRNKPNDVRPEELFLDKRYEGDISIDTIAARCHVTSDETIALRSNVYLCRYQSIGKKTEFEPYTIGAINEKIWKNDENTPSRNVRSTQPTPKRSAQRSKSILKEDNLVHRMKRLSVEITPFKIINKTIIQIPPKNSSENNSDTDESPSKRSKKDSDSSDNKPLQEYIKVSPIKIVKKSGQRYECQRSAKKMNGNDAMIESESEMEDDSVDGKSKPKTVCRNLILDEQFGKTPARKTQRIKSYRETSSSDDSEIKQNEKPHNNYNLISSGRRRLTQIESFSTPKKNLLKGIINGDVNGTPKSILKTPRSQNIGTPKRNIMISEKVSEMTPKRTLRPRTRSMYQEMYTVDDDDDDFEPIRQRPSAKKQTSRRTIATPATTPRKASEMTPRAKMNLFRSGNLKPILASRESDIKERTLDIQMAREKLQVSEIPNSLPCRENEFRTIYSFLEGKIVDHSGGCIYISGVPGTGKTATVTSVIRTLRQQVNAKRLPDFEYVELNAMRLTEPRRAYVHIYRELTGKNLPWEEARTLLEHRFTQQQSNKKKLTTVLLVDELDILCNRRQDVVYNLLDWPTKKSAQLVVVTIANTMDLPERLLMGKVASRLGLTRLTFQPYSFSQLQQVITTRLTGTNSYKNEAIQLVSRKVASVSGDCRRALDICRRAGEIAEETSDNSEDICVSMKNVQQALEEMMASPKIRAIQNCSLLEQIFLRSVVAEVTRTGIEEVTFFGVYTQLESIASLYNAPLLPPNQMLLVSLRLGSSRLIICEHGRMDIYQKICLNVSADDVHYALNAQI